MKSEITIQMTIEHDGSSSVEEITDILEMMLEQDTKDGDDFGITKCTVDRVWITEPSVVGN